MLSANSIPLRGGPHIRMNKHQTTIKQSMLKVLYTFYMQQSSLYILQVCTLLKNHPHPSAIVAINTQQVLEKCSQEEENNYPDPHVSFCCRRNLTSQLENKLQTEETIGHECGTHFWIMQCCCSLWAHQSKWSCTPCVSQTVFFHSSGTMYELITQLLHIVINVNDIMKI